MLAIIQARTSSKRFKNKILFPINGIPLIKHVVNQAKKSKKIIIATSKDKTDDKFTKYLKQERILYFRGELNNVALRLYKLANKKKAKYFVRINGDSPFIDHKIIDRAITISKNSKKNFDIVTNVYPRTFSKGQSVEIIKTNILKKNLANFSDTEKEHVTKYFYKNSRKFCIENFTFKGKKKIMKMSVDTKKDLKNILKILKK